MNISIYDLVVQARSGDSAAFELLLQVFHPTIRHYSRMLKDDDVEQELMIYLWDLISKIPLQDEALRKNKFLFSYIRRSLKHQYVRLSQSLDKIISAEVHLPWDFVVVNPHNFLEDLCLEDLIMRLSPFEVKLIVLIYSYGYTAKEIAALMHVSMQAMNQRKRRVLRKLRQAYWED